MTGIAAAGVFVDESIEILTDGSTGDPASGTLAPCDDTCWIFSKLIDLGFHVYTFPLVTSPPFGHTLRIRITPYSGTLAANEIVINAAERDASSPSSGSHSVRPGDPYVELIMTWDQDQDGTKNKSQKLRFGIM